MAPVIVELAVNGPTPRSVNPHVPREPAEIAAEALRGIEHGAAIVHNHNDEPMFTADGRHSVEPYLAAWAPVLDRHPGALLYRRWAPAPAASPCATGGATSRSWPGAGWAG